MEWRRGLEWVPMPNYHPKHHREVRQGPRVERGRGERTRGALTLVPGGGYGGSARHTRAGWMRGHRARRYCSSEDVEILALTDTVCKRGHTDLDQQI